MVVTDGARQVILKTAADIEAMRPAGRMVGETLRELAEQVRPGLHLADLDRYVEAKFARLGVIPTFQGYLDYPFCLCASVNEQIVHGFPTDRVLKEGDLLSLDLGATIDGWVGDAAITVGVGRISREARRLLDVTRESLEAGIAAARIGAHKGDVGAAIQSVLESAGFGVVRNYVGHGIGRAMHEPPAMPNYGRVGTGMVLQRGMVVALEPMATAGQSDTTVLDDGWTVCTKDGSLAAHFEHTMALRDNAPADVLTAAD